MSSSSGDSVPCDGLRRQLLNADSSLSSLWLALRGNEATTALADQFESEWDDNLALMLEEESKLQQSLAALKPPFGDWLQKPTTDGPAVPAMGAWHTERAPGVTGPLPQSTDARSAWSLHPQHALVGADGDATPPMPSLVPVTDGSVESQVTGAPTTQQLQEPEPTPPATRLATPSVVVLGPMVIHQVS